MKGRVQKLDFNDEAMLSSVEKRFQAGDYLSALRMLNKRNRMYEPTCDASILAADIYEAMKLYPQAADAWFQFLDTCNEADFAEGYEGLAVTYMHMGNEAQSALYYHKMLTADGEITDDEKAQILSMFIKEPRSPLRLVYSEEKGDDCSEYISRGLACLKMGKLKEARVHLSYVSKDSEEYSSAVGIGAMCALMDGDSDTAERECREYLRVNPRDIQTLTTYVAVLSDREEKEKAKKYALILNEIKTKNYDDLYKIATALCEVGLDEEAFWRLKEMVAQNPYDRNILWFFIVSAYKTDRYDEAETALDTLVTVYPRAAVAEYYLTAVRKLLDGETEKPPISYFYRLPEKEKESVTDYLIKLDEFAERSEGKLEVTPEMEEVFRLAFDEMEGHDGELQTFTVSLAVKLRADSFLRKVLLDNEVNDVVKFYALQELTVRNEENSFGTVLCGLYKEFFTHKIQIGRKMRAQFLEAFSDVYSKFALLGEEMEGKILFSAEETYRTLAAQNAYDLMEEREALAAVIYREAHLRHGERGIQKISDLFGANRQTVQRILDRIL